MNERYSKAEVGAGLFIVVGFAALAYLSASISGIELWPAPWTRVTARFASVGDLHEGAAVKMAGVKLGQVEAISLQDYAAEVVLKVDPKVALPTDSIASIRTEGLLGESYVLIRPGGSETDLGDGGRIGQTEPAIDLIDLLVKYALKEDGEAGPLEVGDDLEAPP